MAKQTDKARRILFIAPHRPGRNPSQRFRFEQYIGDLQAAGFSCDLSYLVSERDDRVLYKPGHYLGKLRFLFTGFFRRIQDVVKAGNYGIILIHREAWVLGTTMFEKLIKRGGAKIVFDFDDAIWLADTSSANRRFSFLKSRQKTGRLIEMADMVFAGNDYLADYARDFNEDVEVVPTTIDLGYHKPFRYERSFAPVCIGWTGSLTTVRHFHSAIPFLRELQQKFGHRIKFKMIADAEFEVKELGFHSTRWNAITEIEQLAEIDIGIMPLPDNDWARGKCAFKALQYMAMEIPAIASPVGTNKKVITNGHDGYLADSGREWIDRISALVESIEQRDELGTNGRETVSQRYSTVSLRKRYVSYFNKLAA